ncbi:MAG TPA: Gp138 family membrane-puncturing spike protein [Rhizobium sp.]
MAAPENYFGQRGSFDDTSDYNARDFHIRQVLGQVRTATPVKIIAVHGGGVGAAPTVDVQPLINQIDGQGNKTDHGVIYGIPCTRNQGGGNAIINDPSVGDVGHIVVSDRDTSALKSNQGAQSNPGSFRTHDLADGVYHGAMLNPANPDQYVQFTTTGMKLADKNGNVIEMKSGSIEITGNLHVSGEIIAGYGGSDAVNVQTHIHTDVTPGGGTSGPPEPGT